ncbi:L,D-transpeptidase-like protein [Salsuginibacillus halophilus]|uniref:L,D-transpeptidase-like protein n=1 Tax=Salsuginibacillus halophilus TaxID=517424 RepID=A0A2P8HY20_9BACI|nr:L,D-transpeptidase [Salsuginibacillus halophilus]PSL51113.1 L,D-transpeptidase-like protein [Salsuginibacillus halophilus]
MSVLLTAVLSFAAVVPLWPLDLPAWPGEEELVINTAEQELGVIVEEQLEDVYPVASGTPQTPTPPGVYQVIVKAEKPYYRAENIEGGDPDNPLGSHWIGLDVPGSDGRTYGIHGTNEPEKIGEAVSNGCVRMYNEDVTDLYEQIDYGTRVTVVHEPGQSMEHLAYEALTNAGLH